MTIGCTTDPADLAPSSSLLNPLDLPGDPVASVDHVTDGDTLTMVTGDGRELRIRLIGINAPERDECGGAIARDRLTALVGTPPVTLEEFGLDVFDRTLGALWSEAGLLNEILVSEGLAVAGDLDSSPYGDRLATAEAAAHESQLGIWAPDACGPATDAEVRISAIEPDAPGDDEENRNGEWVEITNDGPTPITLTGWVLRDESTRHRYRFDGVTLAPGATLRVRTGCGEDTPDELFWCDDTAVWSNSGDTALVLDSSGNTVDSWSYGP